MIGGNAKLPSLAPAHARNQNERSTLNPPTQGYGVAGAQRPTSKTEEAIVRDLISSLPFAACGLPVYLAEPERLVLNFAPNDRTGSARFCISEKQDRNRLQWKKISGKNEPFSGRSLR